MQFAVGPFVYKLLIVDVRPVIDGKDCDGIIDFEAEQIMIFTGVRGRRRLNVLLHELRHAWLHHFPHDGGEEADCDLSAHYAQSALQDLHAQGGVDALDALVSPAEREARNAEPVIVTDEDLREMFRQQRRVPLSVVTPLDILRIGRAGRAECAVCCQTFADGNIVTEAPIWHDEAKAMVVKRTLYCDGCGHLQTWLEGIDLAGTPSGVPVTEPRHINDRTEVETFLAKHPKAANVLDHA